MGSLLPESVGPRYDGGTTIRARRPAHGLSFVLEPGQRPEHGMAANPRHQRGAQRVQGARDGNVLGEPLSQGTLLKEATSQYDQIARNVQPDHSPSAPVGMNPPLWRRSGAAGSFTALVVVRRSGGRSRRGEQEFSSPG